MDGLLGKIWIINIGYVDHLSYINIYHKFLWIIKIDQKYLELLQWIIQIWIIHDYSTYVEHYNRNYIYIYVYIYKNLFFG